MTLIFVEVEGVRQLHNFMALQKQVLDYALQLALDLFQCDCFEGTRIHLSVYDGPFLHQVTLEEHLDNGLVYRRFFRLIRIDPGCLD